MNKKFLYATVAAIMGISIGGNIVQENQKKKVKNDNTDLQNENNMIKADNEALKKQCSNMENDNTNLQNENNMIKADNEALKKQCSNMENVNKNLKEENNGFREKEYKRNQEEKQRKDEMKAIEDFEFEGLDSMESIS